MNIALVGFMHVGSLYPFAYNNKMQLKVKDRVVADSDRGIAIGTVMKLIQQDIAEDDIKYIIRKATAQDIKKEQENIELSKEAFKTCKEQIKEFRLPMKLVKAYYVLDRSKAVFYFISPNRVDFRVLVKKIACLLKTRIEMRQIGVRDEARIVGGLGLCGRELCCSKFLRNFSPVSVKMAKDQNMNINIRKISGVCGRLMCCLYYEKDTYNEFLNVAPPIDSIVKAGEIKGRVTYLNPIKKTILIRTEDRVMVEVDIDSVNNIIEYGGKNEGRKNKKK